MIARFLGLLVRVLLETAVLLLVAGCLFGVLAFRVSRRLVVTTADPLERLSGPLSALLKLKLIPKESGEMPVEGVDSDAD